ncbi:MAG: hypothetical protein GF417_09085 [Candidatus Latescibacteria bacterium]|nr:hypothetical protein [bacterium]MBD3424577.1 hypothetical protein [Candidatus Latescibacterota bacterium]
MKKFFVLASVCLLASAIFLHGCESDQSTNVQLSDAGGTGSSGDDKLIDTVFVNDCPPCLPDTIYSDNCPPCDPDTVIVNDCPSQDESPYEGFFQVTSMEAAQVNEPCQYSWIITNTQTVDIRDGYITFAGWLVEWDSSSMSGYGQWNDYYEEAGVFYDTVIEYQITFSDTDNLTAVLTFHTEVGYVGQSASYACDDYFTVTAQRITGQEGVRQILGRKKPAIDLGR